MTQNPLTLTERQQQLTTFCQQLDSSVQRFNEKEALDELQRELAIKVESYRQQEQTLSIGVMGQVKAGKSTFLNALLFNGEPVLPEAATPKTANLTRISWGEIPTLEVEFYSLQEWQELIRLAASEASSTLAEVARELVAMAESNQLEWQSLLSGESIRHFKEKDTAALMAQMNSYVGENGQYTALVKMTHLRINDDRLRGFEIIDTPGMNDPIQSRIQKTRDQMARTDVVFFLSRASQFMDNSDLELLTQQLPGKGVNRIVLVAGQYDSCILDDGWDRASLAETEANLQQRLSDSARDKIQPLVDSQQDAAAAARLARMTRPLLASTYAWGFAQWPQSRWSSGMAHIHSEFREMAEQCWNNYHLTEQDWRRIGNFMALEQAWQEARNDRDEILAEQRLGTEKWLCDEWRKRQEQLQAAVHQRQTLLEDQELATLQHQQKACESRLALFGERIRAQIASSRQQAQQLQAEMVKDLREQSQQAGRVETHTGSKAIRESYTVSTSRWWNPFSWGDSETFYSTRYESYRYARSADVIEQVRRYETLSRKKIAEHFNQQQNMQALKLALKQTLLEVIDTASADFNPAHFRQLLERSLDNFILPQLTMADEDLTQQISQQFQGEVQEGEITALSQALARVLEQLSRRQQQQLEQAGNTLLAQLDGMAEELMQQLTQELRQEMAQLAEDIISKQTQLAAYRRLLAQLAA